MNSQASNKFYILSPVLILIIAHASALLFGRYLGPQVYIPIIVIYWVVLSFILYQYGLNNIREWLQKPQGHWIWIVITALAAFSSLPLFLQHFKVLLNLSILIPTIIFFLINPWLEEFYWRGMLLDITEKWPAWVGVLYSAIFFTLFHSAFAWYSSAARNLPFYLAVLFLGLIMILIRKKTNSLLLAILAHMIINLLNLSIPSLLNMIEFY